MTDKINTQSQSKELKTHEVQKPKEHTVFDFIVPSGIPATLFGLLFTYMAVTGLGKILTPLSERLTNQRLLIQQIQTIATFLIYLIGGTLSLRFAINIDRQTLLALSGTLALALGFALKDFASSVFASLVILITKPFQMGDRVSFNNYYGEVVDIGLRSVRINTLDDNLVTVPSNSFLTDVVANANAGALDCMVVIPIYIHPSADHQKAKKIVRDAILSSQYLFLNKPCVVLTSHEILQNGQSVLKLTAKAYVYDMRFEKQFASDVTEKALSQLKAENIQLV